jgi:hypothetical protein
MPHLNDEVKDATQRRRGVAPADDALVLDKAFPAVNSVPISYRVERKKEFVVVYIAPAGLLEAVIKFIE